LNPIEINTVSVVIPIFNGESTIEKLVEVVIKTLEPKYNHVEIILVNDGSSDDSHACALRAFKKYPDNLKYIQLAKNFSEHNAVMAGLNYVSSDCVCIIDDDFQNPPSEVIKLVEKLKEGYDVVYSYYAKKKHHWFRNLGSTFNDWIATKLLKKPIGLYLSSFKVMHKTLVNNVIKYNGPFPYIDGILLRSTNRIGTQLVTHEYREDGQSNYTFTRLIRLWLNMFTGFSIVPLRVASFIGIIMFVITPFLILFYALSHQIGGVFVKQVIPPGWASIIILVNFFGGLQLLVLGIIGEYIGRLFLTANQSPQFVVRKAYTKKEIYEC